MSYRYGGRLGVNLENEQRRLQREPVAVWKKEWVAPAGAQAQADVKVLKYVRTADVIRFDEEDHAIDDTAVVMDVDASIAQTPPIVADGGGALSDNPLPQPATDSLSPPVRASNDDETMADMSVAAATAVLEAAEEAEPTLAQASASAQDKPAASMSLGSGMSLDGGAAARDTPPVTSALIDEQTTSAVTTEPVEAATLPSHGQPSVVADASAAEGLPSAEVAADPPRDAVANP